MTTLGLDIGGVNTKAACVDDHGVMTVQGRPYELQRAPHALGPVLRQIASEVGAFGDPASRFRCGVTMTAELSQMFRTKREGVSYVLDAVESAFPGSEVCVYSVDGRFLTPAEARQQPLAVAAANWSATAHLVATHRSDALLLIDVGTTTTDVIPIAGGVVAADGRTDPERLASGELVYTGVVRTPAEAIATQVPLGTVTAGVSAEGFALAGDVHVWRGHLDPADYGVPTPDGRPATRDYCGERLARVVCADRDMLDDAAITSIADALAAAQIVRITTAIRQVLVRHPSTQTAVVTGLGAFLGADAADAAGLRVVRLSEELGDAAARCAPAAAVALLLARASDAASPGGHGLPPTSGERDPVGLAIDIVVKLGGGVLAHSEHFAAVLDAIQAGAREQRLVIVPGGGHFADAVREIDRRLTISDDAAHWMAILAMDQYAHLIADRLPGGILVTRPDEIQAALGAGRLPVLAPSRWLRDADPLPHSWNVTSDSIAAWIAGALGAPRLVLVKPPAARGRLVDDYFSQACPPDVASSTVPADQIEAIGAALRSVARI